MKRKEQWRLELRVNHHNAREKIVARSSCKQTMTTIVLSRILEGVHVTGNLLGHMEKVRHSDHDVIDTDKFLEFSKKFYLDTVGLGPFGEPINQPKQ
jgi:hypothetical protein